MSGDRRHPCSRRLNRRPIKNAANRCMAYGVFSSPKKSLASKQFVLSGICLSVGMVLLCWLLVKSVVRDLDETSQVESGYQCQSQASSAQRGAAAQMRYWYMQYERGISYCAFWNKLDDNQLGALFFFSCYWRTDWNIVAISVILFRPGFHFASKVIERNTCHLQNTTLWYGFGHHKSWNRTGISAEQS